MFELSDKRVRRDERDRIVRTSYFISQYQGRGPDSQVPGQAICEAAYDEALELTAPECTLSLIYPYPAYSGVRSQSIRSHAHPIR